MGEKAGEKHAKGGDFRLPQPRKLDYHADFSFCHCEHYFLRFRKKIMRGNLSLQKTKNTLFAKNNIDCHAVQARLAMAKKN